MLRIVAALVVLLAGCSGSSSADPFEALEQLQGQWEGRLDSGHDSLLIAIDRVVGTELAGHLWAENDTHGIYVSEDFHYSAVSIDAEHAEIHTGDGGVWSARSQIIWDREEPQRLLFSGPDSAVLVRAQ